MRRKAHMRVLAPGLPSLSKVQFVKVSGLTAILWTKSGFLS